MIMDLLYEWGCQPGKVIWGVVCPKWGNRDFWQIFFALI